MSINEGGAGIQLYWLPLGAGDNTHCVRINGGAFELLQAAYEHRPRCDLYHSALQVSSAAATFTIEMGPAWGNVVDERGVVGTGPVGLRVLGTSRLFRYEVRCWRGGTIPDVAEAVGERIVLDTDAERTQLLLNLVPQFPKATWGRDEMHTGDLWNSNSLISWLLFTSGHDISLASMPEGGRAPGWSAGIELASRSVRPDAGRTLDHPNADTGP